MPTTWPPAYGIGYNRVESNRIELALLAWLAWLAGLAGPAWPAWPARPGRPGCPAHWQCKLGDRSLSTTILSKTKCSNNMFCVAESILATCSLNPKMTGPPLAISPNEAPLTSYAYMLMHCGLWTTTRMRPRPGPSSGSRPKIGRGGRRPLWLCGRRPQSLWGAAPCGCRASALPPLPLPQLCV